MAEGSEVVAVEAPPANLAKVLAGGGFPANRAVATSPNPSDRAALRRVLA